jgi:hypothetical protein
MRALYSMDGTRKIKGTDRIGRRQACNLRLRCNSKHLALPCRLTIPLSGARCARGPISMLTAGQCESARIDLPPTIPHGLSEDPEDRFES